MNAHSRTDLTFYLLIGSEEILQILNKGGTRNKTKTPSRCFCSTIAPAEEINGYELINRTTIGCLDSRNSHLNDSLYQKCIVSTK